MEPFSMLWLTSFFFTVQTSVALILDLDAQLHTLEWELLFSSTMYSKKVAHVHFRAVTAFQWFSQKHLKKIINWLKFGGIGHGHLLLTEAPTQRKKNLILSHRLWLNIWFCFCVSFIGQTCCPKSAPDWMRWKQGFCYLWK